MHTVSITGRRGELRWVYRSAATLGEWSITSNPHGGILTASVVSADDWAVTQQPLTFVVPRETGPEWVWAIESLQVDGTTLTARLRPDEE